jgi:phosphoesterase RecJ-like protein
MDWIKTLIEQYDTIIIHRHLNPDGDALGTQLGLKHTLKLNYPNKQIYAVGDENVFAYLGSMDTISNDVYTEALVIIVDVCVERLISDKRYKLAKEVIVLDHHLNTPDIDCKAHIDSSKIACAEMVVNILQAFGYQFDDQGATCFLAGVITDSGRFLYPSTSPDTFETTAFLLKKGAKLQWIYEKLYTEELNFKKLKGHFINNFSIYENHIAYMKNKKEISERFNVSTFTVSRAMVNQMSGIKGIDAWINFTESDEGIMVEMRSKRVPIIDVAMQYGGGGHALACGCTLNSFKDIDYFLVDLHEHLVRSNKDG